MSAGSSRRRVVALSVATAALLAAGALWTLGSVTPMRPGGLRALLVTSPALALIALAIGGGAAASGPARFAIRLSAVVCVLSSLLFVLAFVYAPPRLLTGGWARAEGGAPDRLRVVSFNVLHGYPELDDPGRRAGDLARALDALAPDLVLLQEAWCLAGEPCLVETLGDRLGLSWAFASANGAELIGFEEGCAILSRFPLRDARRWELRPRARPWRRRAALVAAVDLDGAGSPGPPGLQLVCAHLENEPRTATAQAGELAGRLGELGVVLLGADLNLVGASDGVRRLTEAGLIDVLPDGIDHVMLAEDAGWRVERAEVRLGPEETRRLLGREIELSDHRALVVDLARSQGGGGPDAGASGERDAAGRDAADHPPGSERDPSGPS